MGCDIEQVTEDMLALLKEPWVVIYSLEGSEDVNFIFCSELFCGACSVSVYGAWCDGFPEQ